MGWAWIVKAWVLNPAYLGDEAEQGSSLPPKYHYQTVYEGREESEAIAAWKKAKADGAGCVVIEDRS